MNFLKPLMIALPLLAACTAAPAETLITPAAAAHPATTSDTDQSTLAGAHERVQAELRDEIRKDLQDNLPQRLQALLPPSTHELALNADPAFH